MRQECFPVFFRTFLVDFIVLSVLAQPKRLRSVILHNSLMYTVCLYCTPDDPLSLDSGLPGKIFHGRGFPLQCVLYTGRRIGDTMDIHGRVLP